MSKPFIHLFTTPFGYYCYDVNTGRIIEIDEEIYGAVKAASWSSADVDL